MSKLITPKEAAELMRISLKTLYRWKYEGKMPSIKLGGKLLFQRSDIEELIQKSRIEAISG